MKTLSNAKKTKFNKILKNSSIELEKDKLTHEEKIELKSYAIFTKLKKQKYVRN